MSPYGSLCSWIIVLCLNDSPSLRPRSRVVQGNAQLPNCPRRLFPARASRGFAAREPPCCHLWAPSSVLARLLSRHLPLASPVHIRLNLINVWRGWRRPRPSRPLLSGRLPGRCHLVCVQTRQGRQLHRESEHVCRIETNRIWVAWTVLKFESRLTPGLPLPSCSAMRAAWSSGLGDEATCHLVPRF